MYWFVAKEAIPIETQPPNQLLSLEPNFKELSESTSSSNQLQSQFLC